MSTKIYNGYKLPVLELAELHKFAKTLGRQISEASQELEKKKVIEIAVAIIDGLCVDKKIPTIQGNLLRPDAMIMTVANGIIAQARADIKRTGRRDPEMDFDFEVLFIPTPDKILAMLFTEKEEFEQIWKQQPGVDFYGYWNNTDRPDDLTDEEWEARGKEWDIALNHDEPGYDIPSQNGFVYSPKTDWLYLFQVRDTDITPYLPDYNKRLDGHADIQTGNEFIHLNRDTLVDKDGKVQIMKFMQDFRNYKQTPEGQKHVKDNRDKIESIIIKNITNDHLLMTVKEFLPKDDT